MGKLAELREAARREAQEASGRLALAPALQEMRALRTEMATLGMLLRGLPDAVVDRLAPVLEAADRLGSRGTPASGGGARPGDGSANGEWMVDAQAWRDLRDSARRQGQHAVLAMMDEIHAAAARRPPR